MALVGKRKAKIRSPTSGGLRGNNEAGAAESSLAPYREILLFAIPMLFTLAADPLASIVDTAFVGHIGPGPLAGVGMAGSIYNSIVKLFNVPLLSVTTSTVAMARGASNRASNAVSKAASAGLYMALMFGLLEAVLVGVGSPLLATVWGAPPGDNAIRHPTLSFLLVRGFGAPATVLLLVLQGIFRGLNDTQTPLVATVVSTILNIALEPVFIFVLKLNVMGSAAATIIAELLPAMALLIYLHRLHPLILNPRKLDLSALVAMFRPTGFLVLRTVAITAVYAVATSLASRAGPIPAATHQVCFQIWLACSMMADSLAVAAQTLLARSIAAGELKYGRRVVRCTLYLAAALGVALTGLLGAAERYLPELFTTNREVISMIHRLMPLVVGTQLLNTFAFIWDGILYGAGGFRYASAIMPLCAAPAVGAMFAGYLWQDEIIRLYWVWAGLSVVMLMRSLTIWLPYWMRRYPFACLFAVSEATEEVEALLGEHDLDVTVGGEGDDVGPMVDVEDGLFGKHQEAALKVPLLMGAEDAKWQEVMIQEDSAGEDGEYIPCKVSDRESSSLILVQEEGGSSGPGSEKGSDSSTECPMGGSPASCSYPVSEYLMADSSSGDSSNEDE